MKLIKFLKKFHLWYLRKDIQMNKLPNKSKLIQKELRNTDNRGEIISIIDAEIFNVSIITCENKSIRSNHYHKRLSFMYVLEGQIDYFFKDLDTKKISYYKVLKDTIFIHH